MTNMRERMIDAADAEIAKAITSEDGMLWNPGQWREEAEALVDAILSVLEKPRDGMRQAAIDAPIDEASEDSAATEFRAMIRAIRNGA